MQCGLKKDSVGFIRNSEKPGCLLELSPGVMERWAFTSLCQLDFGNRMPQLSKAALFKQGMSRRGLTA